MSVKLDNVIGFHHAGIVVPDLDKAIDFYTKLLGYEVMSQSSWGTDHAGFNQIVGLEASAARFCMLKGGNAFLELFEYSSPPSSEQPAHLGANDQGIRHIGIAVRDVDAMVRRCIQLGGSAKNASVSVPGAATATYCRDPFGNLLEFVTPGGRFPDPIIP